MHKINRIRISGFRRLRSVDLPMRPLMVLIGANGVGKTSILEALSLLSASASGAMNKTLNAMGGIGETATHGQPKEIAFESEMECPGHLPLRYALKVESRGQAYAIPSETLSQEREGYDSPFIHITAEHDRIRYYNVDKKGLAAPEWEHNPTESALSQVPKMFKQPEDLRRDLSSMTKYHVLDVGPRAPVKLPQQLKPAHLPGEDGEDLLSFLFNLRESDRARYETIEDTLKVAFPGFECLGFPPTAAGMLSMTWKEKQFRDPLYAHQLSEGTLRFLWLISLLQSPHLSTVTMIDEPEVSLHPELLSLLVDTLREASERTQVIVATHSDRLIRFLEPNEVVVMDIGEDGFATATWAEEMDLETWLEDYSLDDAWRMGRMGGRS